MRTKEWQHLPQNNPLADLHDAVVALSPAVRAAICTALHWSEPTYFRKMRGIITPEHVAVIIPIIHAHLQQLNNLFDKYNSP